MGELEESIRDSDNHACFCTAKALCGNCYTKIISGKICGCGLCRRDRAILNDMRLEVLQRKTDMSRQQVEVYQKANKAFKVQQAELIRRSVVQSPKVTPFIEAEKTDKEPEYIEILAYWLEAPYKDIESIVHYARLMLQSIEYDTIVGAGLSGSLVIPAIARALNKHWCIVRKDDENRHSTNAVEGRIGHKWIFVDDFISQGTTRYKVIQAIEKVIYKRNSFTTEYVGTYQYHKRYWEAAHPMHRHELY